MWNHGELITSVWNFAYTKGVPEPYSPESVALRPDGDSAESRGDNAGPAPLGNRFLLGAEPYGCAVDSGWNPTGSMIGGSDNSGSTPLRDMLGVGSGPGEGADDAKNRRDGRQPSDDDETTGNPDEETKDAKDSHLWHGLAFVIPTNAGIRFRSRQWAIFVDVRATPCLTGRALKIHPPIISE